MCMARHSDIFSSVSVHHVGYLTNSARWSKSLPVSFGNKALVTCLGIFITYVEGHASQLMRKTHSNWLSVLPITQLQAAHNNRISA